MLTKLTLTINKSTIAKAKKFAQERNKSLSRIVEGYLANLSSGQIQSSIVEKLESPITDSLVGMFKDKGKDYKKMIEEARLEKHL